MSTDIRLQIPPDPHGVNPNFGNHEVIYKVEVTCGSKLPHMASKPIQLKLQNPNDFSLNWRLEILNFQFDIFIFQFLLYLGFGLGIYEVGAGTETFLIPRELKKRKRFSEKIAAEVKILN